MSYDQVTDLPFQHRHGRDTKDNLIEYEKIFKSVYIGNVICVSYKKDRRYYVLSDVAIWSRCGNIRQALFLRLKNRPRGQFKTFHGREQFLVRNKDKYAIYNVEVYSRTNVYDNKNQTRITEVGFKKVPNLQECTCH